MLSRLPYLAAVAAIGVLISSSPVTAHDDDPTSKNCHTSCLGAPPARAKHKHPEGKCDSYSLCPTAMHDVTGSKMAFVQQPLSKRSTIGSTAGQEDYLKVADAGGWWTRCWVVVGDTTYIDTSAQNSDQCYKSLSKCLGRDDLTTHFRSNPVLQSTKKVTKCSR